MWKVPWFDYKHSGVSSPSPPAHPRPRFQSYWMWNSQSNLTRKILKSTLYSFLVEPCIERCCFTAREHFMRRTRPMVRNLRLHFHLSCNSTLCYVSTSTSLFFKAGNHPSKNQVFSDSIHNNTFVSKPCSLKLYKATLEMSFSGVLCCAASAKGGAGYTHTSAPPRFITQREAPLVAFRGHRVLLTTC